jgi:hypothetical protein
VSYSYSQAMEAQMRIYDYLGTSAGIEWAGNLARNIAKGGLSDSEAIDRFLRTFKNQVIMSDPFYVSPDICDVIYTSSQGFPRDATMEDDAVIMPTGLIYLSKTFEIFDPRHNEVRNIAAIYWTKSMNRSPQDGSAHRGIEIHWFESRGGWLLPVSFCYWPYGDMVGDWKATYNGEPTTDHLDVCRKHFLTFMSFIRQKIMTTQQERASRPTRKRAASYWEHEPSIRVVHLRKSDSRSEGGNSSTHLVERDHRWWVSRHWRLQACGPEMSDRRPVFIESHVKGPEDKPLKPPRAKVFAVVR